jgi:alpha-D-ribose 1-methylphosphonate 5-triphosphate diphosphatase
MGTKSCVYGGPVFDGERLFDTGSVIFEDGRVVDVLQGDHHNGINDAWDAYGKLIAPGLVDIHSDALEKCIEMRPGVHFDSQFALECLDRRLAGCGITTYCHAISFADDTFSIRSSENAERLVRLIKTFSFSGRALVRHMVHVRYEISSLEAAARIEHLIDKGLVDLVSIMDHTPGQGRFKTLQSCVAHKTGTFGITPEEAMKAAENKSSLRPDGLKILDCFAQKVKASGLPFLSHNDDSVEKIDFVRSLGVTGCEFPISIEAVEAAKGFEMRVFMGAPNLFRDRSSSGHLKASETILQGLCDGLISDFYPECLLQMPFIANKRYGLKIEEILRLLTSNTGDFLACEPRPGRLAPGSGADVIVIDATAQWASVSQTWVAGMPVLFQRQSGTNHGIVHAGKPGLKRVGSTRAA